MGESQSEKSKRRSISESFTSLTTVLVRNVAVSVVVRSQRVGTTPTAGRTVGVNPSLIKYGTKLQIGKEEGYVAEDTGGGIGWYHLDVFCNSHQEALNAGVGYKKVYAIKTTKYKKKKIKVKVPVYEVKK